jgi:hypothetical protein
LRRKLPTQELRRQELALRGPAQELLQEPALREPQAPLPQQAQERRQARLQKALLLRPIPQPRPSMPFRQPLLYISNP